MCAAGKAPVPNTSLEDAPPSFGANDLQYFLSFDIPDQDLKEPTKKKPYISVCILAPLITVERHDGDFHFAVRFNLQTSILGYEKEESDHNEHFIQSICLEYLSSITPEDVDMQPRKDPPAAMKVTKDTTNTTSGQAAITATKIPSASVTLGITRARRLVVEYTADVWTVDSHPLPIDPEASHSNGGDNPPAIPRYQWFWEGTQTATKTLSPEVRHAVTHHVVAKRIISAEEFLKYDLGDSDEDQSEGGDSADPDMDVEIAKSSTLQLIGNLTGDITGKDALPWKELRRRLREEIKNDSRNKVQRSGHSNIQATDMGDRDEFLEATKQGFKDDLRDEMVKEKLQNRPELWEKFFKFNFQIQVQVRRRWGRTHRILGLSGNEVKATLLKPVYKNTFDIEPRERVNLSEMPLDDTHDIDEILSDVKDRYEGKWDRLVGKALRRFYPPPKPPSGQLTDMDTEMAQTTKEKQTLPQQLGV